jgi:hypothetical protein
MRRAWAIAVLPLVLAACGSQAKTSRLDLTTPGVHTGDPVPEASATATPSATAQATDKPVTRAEKRVMKGWSDSLRRGEVNAASEYFSVPSLVSNNQPMPQQLASVEDVREFNRTLPCGAKLLHTRRSDQPGFVIGVFRLTERKNAPAPCGQGVGAEAAVAFEISRGHIKTWLRVATPGEEDPMATATPTPTPTATPTPSATASATPTATPTPTDTADPNVT